MFLSHPLFLAPQIPKPYTLRLITLCRPVLRAVAEEDKGIALGTLTVFISLFAFIPAPIIMGAIIGTWLRRR